MRGVIRTGFLLSLLLGACSKQAVPCGGGLCAAGSQCDTTFSPPICVDLACIDSQVQDDLSWLSRLDADVQRDPTGYATSLQAAAKRLTPVHFALGAKALLQFDDMINEGTPPLDLFEDPHFAEVLQAASDIPLIAELQAETVTPSAPACTAYPVSNGAQSVAIERAFHEPAPGALTLIDPCNVNCINLALASQLPSRLITSANLKALLTALKNALNVQNGANLLGSKEGAAAAILADRETLWTQADYLLNNFDLFNLGNPKFDDTFKKLIDTVRKDVDKGKGGAKLETVLQNTTDTDSLRIVLALYKLIDLSLAGIRLDVKAGVEFQWRFGGPGKQVALQDCRNLKSNHCAQCVNGVPPATLTSTTTCAPGCSIGCLDKYATGCRCSDPRLGAPGGTCAGHTLRIDQTGTGSVGREVYDGKGRKVTPDPFPCYADSTLVKLTVTPDSVTPLQGWIFTSWGEDCQLPPNFSQCTVDLTKDERVAVTFRNDPCAFCPPDTHCNNQLVCCTPNCLANGYNCGPDGCDGTCDQPGTACGAKCLGATSEHGGTCCATNCNGDNCDSSLTGCGDKCPCSGGAQCVNGACVASRCSPTCNVPPAGGHACPDDGCGTSTCGGSACSAGTTCVNGVCCSGSCSSGTPCVNGVCSTCSNDFSISVSPASQTVQAGGSVVYTVATLAVSGTPEAVTLSLSPLPPGVSGGFSSSSMSAGQSSTLTLTADPSTATSYASITVTGSAQCGNHSATAAVTVNGSGGFGTPGGTCGGAQTGLCIAHTSAGDCPKCGSQNSCGQYPPDVCPSSGLCFCTDLVITGCTPCSCDSDCDSNAVCCH